ncbi:MAG TPA: 50S ribosomal protein L29 [Candidatus Omnitrophica bacterium]|nr:MAG: 50S ribosomal protein L29 [Omnitrophica WOR_2 bacterium GWA2_45_18]OGX19675.1 MAG: 50S ribosomal protein L29 [Omnitrophica WOR_2 bacterium GWC2_45_7]HBR14644.1 50S ribosomal protein L29 [Candidatus Omnitrophota bacterium]
MKAKELRGISTEELAQKEKGLKKELFELNYQRKMGIVEKPSRFKTIRREIARIFTIARERALEKK